VAPWWRSAVIKLPRSALFSLVYRLRECHQRHGPNTQIGRVCHHHRLAVITAGSGMQAAPRRPEDSR